MLLELLVLFFLFDDLLLLALFTLLESEYQVLALTGGFWFVDDLAVSCNFVENKFQFVSQLLIMLVPRLLLLFHDALCVFKPIFRGNWWMRKWLRMLVGCIFLIGKCLFVFIFVPLRCLRVRLVSFYLFLVHINTLVDCIMILICMQGFWVDFLFVNIDLLDMLVVL